MIKYLKFFVCKACLGAYPYHERHRAMVVSSVRDLNSLKPIEAGSLCFICPTCYSQLAAGEKAEELPPVGGTDCGDD